MKLIRVKRYGLIAWVYSSSPCYVIFAAVLFYVDVAVVLGLIYMTLQDCLSVPVVTSEATIRPWDYLYFSFVTQTTLGYGDYAATGFGKLLCAFQSVFGIFSFSLIIPLIIVKLWAPEDAVVFADQAELSLDCVSSTALLRFRCINTHRMILRDVRVICYFTRLIPEGPQHGHANTRLAVLPNELPYMGRDVWYFNVYKSGKRLYKLLENSTEYKLKVLIVGMYGNSPYAVEHVYARDKLIEGTYVPESFNPDEDRSIGPHFHWVAPCRNGRPGSEGP